MKIKVRDKESKDEEEEGEPKARESRVRNVIIQDENGGGGGGGELARMKGCVGYLLGGEEIGTGQDHE